MMKKLQTTLLVGTSALVLALTACNGNGSTAGLQAQVDSLTAKVEQQANDLDYYNSCLTLLSDGLDSIATYDNALVGTIRSKEGTVTKESIRENLNSYASMLAHQRERISQLENQLNSTTSEVSKMKTLLDFFKQQVAEKDATIADLQEKIERKDFQISMLEATIDQLTTANANLTATVKDQREAINVAQDMLNEAYYVIGTSKELKRIGIVSGGGLTAKRINSDNVNTSNFKRIDIRENTRIAVNDKKIKILSQHPSSSYRIDSDKNSNTSVINILDEVAFWSQTRYLVIEKD